MGNKTIWSATTGSLHEQEQSVINENMLREALTCVGQKSEGELGLLELVEQCTVWMKEKKCPN